MTLLIVPYKYVTRYFSGMKANEDKKVKQSPSAELLKLAERIKTLRIKKGYKNYESFAYQHDLPRAQFGRYERGEDLRYSSLLKVIKALGVTVEEFFSEGFSE